MAETRHKQLDLYCKLVVGYVAMASFLIFHIIDVTSRHFAVAFNIPEQNISIFFDKLYSLRCLGSVIGYAIEYILYQIGGGDRNDKNEGLKVRKYVGIISFSLLLIVRTALLVALYVSKHLGYHVYLILWLEGFIYSVHEQSHLGLAPEYISVGNLMFNLDKLFILLFQWIMDVFWYSRPILIIKIQIWVCVIATATAVVLWGYYNFTLRPELDSLKSTSLSQNKGPDEGGTVTKVDGHDGKENGASLLSVTKNQDKDGIDAVVVPFMLFFGSSMTKDFLYPGTLPYALLEKDKCHIINKSTPFFIILGPLMNFILDIFDLFVKWEWYFNLFLLLTIPMPIIFVYSLLAIHTQIPSALRIRNSLPIVLAMASTMIFCHGNLEPLSFLAIGKYAARGNAYGFTIQAAFQTTCLLSRSIFSRLSAGYTDTRVSLGYYLPKFRPNHQMSNSNTFFYILRQSCRKSWRDIKGDFKYDIKKYL